MSLCAFDPPSLDQFHQLGRAHPLWMFFDQHRGNPGVDSLLADLENPSAEPITGHRVANVLHELARERMASYSPAAPPPPSFDETLERIVVFSPFGGPFRAYRVCDPSALVPASDLRKMGEEIQSYGDLVGILAGLARFYEVELNQIAPGLLSHGQTPDWAAVLRCLPAVIVLRLTGTTSLPSVPASPDASPCSVP